MFIKNLTERPFKLISIFGIIYLVTNIVLNIFTGFSYNKSILPYSELIFFITEIISLICCLLTYFFYTRHFIYYIGMEILIFSDLYTGEIYTALFLSSLLLVLLITENRIISFRNLIIYIGLEVAKLGLVIQYGVVDFFNYFGLSLFSLCIIGCMNLLFRHAYNRKDNATFNIDNYKFSDRQKECIKEIVMDNVTIKALAINYNVSESAIKKDLAYIYNELGITGKADLKALFIDYKF